MDLLAIQGAIKSLIQHHSPKASILQCSAFFRVQLSHLCMTAVKTIALTRWTFVGKVILNIYLFVYFWLCWVLVAGHGLSPAVVCRLLVVWSMDSRVLRLLVVAAHMLQSVESLVAAHGLSCPTA